jgi:hypothetical protein
MGFVRQFEITEGSQRFRRLFRETFQGKNRVYYAFSSNQTVHVHKKSRPIASASKIEPVFFVKCPVVQ